MKNVKQMDELRDIYERITFLRQKGIKMKNIADAAGIAPSVLSAIYTTVLPECLKNMKAGMDANEALGQSLVWVNNVSRKKFSEITASLKMALFSDKLLKSDNDDNDDTEPFTAMLRRNMSETADRIMNFSGIYMSYSISSGSSRLKAEPYLITPSASGKYVEVWHNNAYGITHRGAAMMNGYSHLYLTFNENTPPQLSLFQICLRLPMYDRPPFLKGLYMCLDYNHNPIARRILLVKQSDSISHDEFMKIKGELKDVETLDEKEKIYYAYTCGGKDVIRMCDIPSPQMTYEDLAVEKKILEL